MRPEGGEDDVCIRRSPDDKELGVAVEEREHGPAYGVRSYCDQMDGPHRKGGERESHRGRAWYSVLVSACSTTESTTSKLSLNSASNVGRS